MTADASPTELPEGETTRDRRAARRQRLLLGGKIVQWRGITFDCTIRDLTERGARVRLSRVEGVDDHFQLIEIRSGFAYDAEVVWREGVTLGLRFVARQDLRGGGRTDHLALLWQACAPR